MKRVDEIKKAPYGSFSKVYGISVDEFDAVNMEMTDIVEQLLTDRTINATLMAFRVLEDVLNLREYSSEQLLRLAVFLRNYGRYFEKFLKDVVQKTLENPEYGRAILQIPASYEILCPELNKLVPRVFCKSCPLSQECPECK